MWLFDKRPELLTETEIRDMLAESAELLTAIQKLDAWATEQARPNAEKVKAAEMRKSAMKRYNDIQKKLQHVKG